jgi:hypothetical protein
VARSLKVVAGGRPALRQGAVYAAAPIFWVPENLQIIRPPGSRDWTEARGHDWQSLSDRFRTGDRVEQVVVHAKMRPVVVVSHEAELRGHDPVRAIPVYSYNPGSHADRQRAAIEAGELMHALHLGAARDLREGYLNLREAAVIPRTFFADAEYVGDLDKLSLATLLRHYATYIAA